MASSMESKKAQIRAFADLPEGWRFGDGNPASGDAVRTALGVVDLIEKRGVFSAVEVFPDVRGGVLVSGHYGKASLEVLCGPGGQIEVWEETEDDILGEDDDVSIEEIDSRLRKLAACRKLSSSGSSHSIISIATDDASQARLSRTHRTDPEYRFLASNAPTGKAMGRAPISQGTTGHSSTAWRSSGESGHRSFPKGLIWNGRSRQPETPAISTSGDCKGARQDVSSRRWSVPTDWKFAGTGSAARSTTGTLTTSSASVVLEFSDEAGRARSFAAPAGA